MGWSRYVQVRGEKQHTKVMKQRLSCVFDDLFFFSLKGLTAEVRGPHAHGCMHIRVD
jgi:hypothetical protein